MKKIAFLFIFLLITSNSFSADTKVVDEANLAAPANEDLVYCVDDPSGTPLDRKCTLGNVFSAATDLDTNGVISANSVALGTDTTGNYAAGDAEAGAATSGDSATSFWASGTCEVARGCTGAATLTDGGVLLGSGTNAITAMSVLGDGAIIVGDGTTDPVALTAFTNSTGDVIHEAGGLEADVNAYDGIIGITGGSTFNQTGTTTQIIIFDGAGAPTSAALSSHASMTNAGAVTIVDFALTTDADAGNFDIDSLDRLEFFDAGLFIDGGTDGVLLISTDGTGEIATADWDISTTGAITNATIEGEGGVISTGEAGGTKFLREDGDGTSSWQATGGSQNLWATFDATPNGSTTADSTTDTLTIATSSGVTAAISGDTLTIGSVNNDASFGLTIDGGSSAIATGFKGQIEVPYNMTIDQATLLLNEVGSVKVDIWKDTFANYPPTIADSITAASPVQVANALKSQDTTLPGWTTTVTSGDIVAFNVLSASGASKVTVTISGTKN